ncbi:hypothetical protein Tco_0235172, partial [Tanacetum coccineum]
YALFTCLPDMYTLIMTGSDEPTFGRGGNVISPIPSCPHGVTISCLVPGPVGSRQPRRLFKGLNYFFYSEDLSRTFDQVR